MEDEVREPLERGRAGALDADEVAHQQGPDREALGATAKELSKFVDTAEARQQARLGGLKCEEIADGHAALKVFMSSFLMSPANAAAILVGFLVVFHVIAHVGARYMYKARRYRILFFDFFCFKRKGEKEREKRASVFRSVIRKIR